MKISSLERTTASLYCKTGLERTGTVGKALTNVKKTTNFWKLRVSKKNIGSKDLGSENLKLATYFFSYFARRYGPINHYSVYYTSSPAKIYQETSDISIDNY